MTVMVGNHLPREQPEASGPAAGGFFLLSKLKEAVVPVPCLTPTGRTDCHNSSTKRRPDGVVVCVYCGEPTRGGAPEGVEIREEIVKGLKRYRWRHPAIRANGWSRLYVELAVAARGASMALRQQDRPPPTEDEVLQIETRAEQIPNPMYRDGGPRMVARYRWRHPALAGGEWSRLYEEEKSARNAAFQSLRKRKPG